MPALANPKSARLREAWLKYVFQSLVIGPFNHITGRSGALANLHLSLHTADPGEASDQSTNEATFTGYGRVAIARSTTGWEVVDLGGGAWAARNLLAATFGRNTGSTQVVTHLGIGTLATTGGVLLYRQALPGGSVSVAAGRRLYIPPQQIVVEER